MPPLTERYGDGSVDARSAFEGIVGSLAPPMYVATAANGDERAGCLVGFASQCGIDPPRFMVWISKANHTYEIVRQAPVITVHALRIEDIGLAKHFGELSGDTVDKFKDVGWADGPGGSPGLDDVDWFAGAVLDRVDCGDHLGLLLEPIDGRCDHADRPGLTLRDVDHLEPGHPA